MKNKLMLTILLAALVGGCATNSSSVKYSHDVRQMSYADNSLFHDALNGPGGLAETDRTLFPAARRRTIIKIESLVPFKEQQTGLERWTVQHDGKDTCAYVVRYIPQGNGKVQVAVHKSSETKP